MSLWIWQGIGFETPEDWEMLRFSRNPEVGRVAFADRRGYRFEVAWRRIEGRPDMSRLVSDYAAKLEREGAIEDMRRVELAGRAGVEGSVRGTRTTRLLWLEGGLSFTIEAAFFRPEGAEAAPREEILASFAPEPVWRDHLRRWKAFGMDLLACDGLSLVACDVRPAAAVMAFGRDPGDEPDERFERLGMVRSWLRVSTADWLAAQAPDDVAAEPPFTYAKAGHEIAAARGVFAGRTLRPKKMRYEAAAWICPADGRLYHVSRRCGPDEDPDSSELAGVRLACCQELGEPA